MSGWRRAGLVLAMVGVATLAEAPTARATRGPRRPLRNPTRTGITVARMSVAENLVEQAVLGGEWVRSREGSPVQLGDRIRTGPDSSAYLDFPWMSVLVGPGSVVWVRPSLVLALELESGRLEPKADAADMIKLLTAETEIRGQGRVVVRRQEGATLVTVIDGRFRVDGGGKEDALAAGEASVVTPTASSAPEQALPDPPDHLWPGADPIYATRGEPIPLTWTSSAASHHMQLLALNSDTVLLARDIGPSPDRIQIPWPGTFRWRVSARDGRGLEGLPSRVGLICVMDK